jgi:alpha-beta hydrolase superfamily lysophospholipase
MQDGGATDGRRPSVHVRPASGVTRAVALLLHGGKEASYDPADPMHLSSRRMRPFARAIHRQGASAGIAVWTLAYRYRGWNGAAMSPVHDARWALEEVRRVHGGVPVVLLGHSMGGRVAVRVLDDPSVTAMVALAPWLPREPSDVARDRSVLLVHGLQDRTTDPRETRAWAEAARPVARSLTTVELHGAGHYLLRRVRLWTDLGAGYVLAGLGVEPRVGATARRVLDDAASGVPSVTL